VDFLWQSPDQPSEISLFFCFESSTVESDQGYALLEKIDKLDAQKASKQKIKVPSSYIAALWMLKNMRAVFSLLFGEKSQTSKCLSSWITHFEFNRVYYNSLQEADKSFLTQVLFAIDRALQIYWQSCSENEDRRAINTRILQMQDLQNNIKHHNFSFILPKILLNKFLTEPSDSSNGNENGRKPGKKRDKDDAEKDNKKNKKG